ncbi:MULTISPECIES: hypothetical protein [Roseivirga]|uniref:Lipoprotein n=1 Tax=Roseivirga thermotolerans TaxID=1758176 RepID=A0ABQ3IA83_9BACT|nr:MULTISPECIES: hypothetical protein [Roseivirga]GHE69287.1 hypothetical protein GCM10011340_26540 [Roseivirga thermotolerans]|tara:strand:- start:9475 stop:9888 length:414 start_codon:yes stop_codon:yes gene_type:complete
MKKLFYSIYIIAFATLVACEVDNPASFDDCPVNLLCTEEFRHYTYSPKTNNQPILLDDYYVKNLDNGNIYLHGSNQLPLHEGQYLVITDAAISEIKRKGTVVRFFGVKNNTIILETDFLVGHDCCHVTPLSGPFDQP